MDREIDILTRMDGDTFVVVEKATHQVWMPEELAAARVAGCYTSEDRLAAADGDLEVSGPFPGCLQQAGASADFFHYRLAGQTRHFLIFARPGSRAARPNLAPVGGGT
jgi:hypothetical protein